MHDSPQRRLAPLHGRYTTLPRWLHTKASVLPMTAASVVRSDNMRGTTVMTAFVRAAVAGVLLGASACGPDASRSAGDTTRTAAASRGSDLTGAGATFPYPLYSKWFSEYAAKTGVKINYQSIGSGGGIRQLSEQTVDFGASDAPMTDEELAKARGGEVLHIPTVIG